MQLCKTEAEEKETPRRKRKRERERKRKREREEEEMEREKRERQSVTKVTSPILILQLSPSCLQFARVFRARAPLQDSVGRELPLPKDINGY